MSPVQSMRLVGFNASLSKRGVVFSITPGDEDATALVEVVDAVSRQRLKIQDELISHVLHFKREDLQALFDADQDTDATTLKQWLVLIERFNRDEGSYRVQYFSDDPQRPAVMFFCVTI